MVDTAEGDPAVIEEVLTTPAILIPFAVMEVHYMLNNDFMRRGQLLDGVAAMARHKHKVAMISNIEHARSIKQHYTHPSISRSHTPLRLCHCARTS